MKKTKTLCMAVLLGLLLAADHWPARAQPENDGKQTPMKNHPVFIAQHATATCCRKCLEKWHHIPQGKLLTDEQVDFIIQLISQWLKRANQV